MPEEHGLDVVPLPRYRIHVVIIPHVLEHLVLLRDERLEVYEHRNRVSLDIPATYTHAYALVIEALAPPRQKRMVGSEFGVRMLLHQIGSYDDIIVAHTFGHRERLGRNYRMYASNLVAYLPTHLKQIVGHLTRITHKIVVFVYHLNPFGNQKSSESRCKDNTYI